MKPHTIGEAPIHGGLIVFFPDAVERFMQEAYPAGSKWLAPGADESITVLRHERRDGTPEWYKNGPVRFVYPVAIVTGRGSDGAQAFDCGDLARLVPADQAAEACRINLAYNPDHNPGGAQ